MKKRSILLITSLVFLITSCEVAFLLGSPSGYVYNTKVQNGVIADAKVILSSTSNSDEYDTTSNSSGKYSFDEDVEYGEYELTAEKSGYIFIKQIVIVSQNGTTLPNIGGFSDDGIDSSTVSIVTFWDRDFEDVDAHLTFPSQESGNATFTGNDFYNLGANSAKTGFAPTTTTNRGHVYYQNKNFTDDDDDVIIELDVDNTGAASQPKGGPETVTIGFIHPYSNYNSDYKYTAKSNDASGLEAGDYSCVGVMEFYLDAFETNTKLSSSDNKDAANPRVFLFAGSKQIGYFELPKYTNIERASVFRINSFINSAETKYYFQFLPDIKLYTDANIRNVNNGYAPIIVEGNLK